MVLLIDNLLAKKSIVAFTRIYWLFYVVNNEQTSRMSQIG